MFGRALVIVISSALFGTLMKIVFKMREGKTTIEDGIFEGAVIRVNRLFYNFVIISNIFFLPLGIMAFFAMLMFIAENDKENIIYTSWTFFCSVTMFIIWRYIKYKKICISKKGIWVKTLLMKKKFYVSSEIRYVTKYKIKILLGSSGRKITITRLYDNYEVLLMWLEMNCKEIKKSNRKRKRHHYRDKKYVN